MAPVTMDEDDFRICRRVAVRKRVRPSIRVTLTDAELQRSDEEEEEEKEEEEVAECRRRKTVGVQPVEV